MEEKKLTDEEIVKALDNCVNGDYKTKCKGCPYDDEVDYCKVMDRDVLDLIHRLQAKYRNLEINYNDVYEHYRELELAEPKLKAEIERLNLAVEGLTATNKVIDKENTELIEKIERLTEENEYLDGCAKQFLADYQNAQVQVDELERKNQAFEKVLDSYKDGEFSAKMVATALTRFYEPIAIEFKEQAVKDTAKEILGKANELWLDTINPNCLIGKIENWVKERYGVEVE